MKAVRILLILLACIAAGVFGAHWLSVQQRYDLGEVVVRMGGNDYITQLPQAALVLVIALLLLWLLWRLALAPFRLWGRHRRKQARARLVEGLQAQENGQWARAEKLLLAAADDSEVGTIALAGAAQAQEARGDAEAARQTLARLEQRDPVAHALLQGERLLAAGQPLQAIAALDVAAAQPLPPRGVLLRTRALAQAGRSAEGYGQLGALRKAQVLEADDIAALEHDLATRSLQEAADGNALAERWEVLPKSLRLDPQVAATYASRAAALHWDDAALRSIEQALDTRWDESLAILYGQLPLEKYDSRRASAQRWLQAHPDSPGLLLTLARLAGHQGQWPQAEEFLHRAIAQGAGAQAWEELGHGLAAAGDDAGARACYANALRVNRGEPVQPLPQTRELHEKIRDQAVAEERDAHGIPRLRS
ncbi:heme biosynthesis HemY N-terminal domain-containing protein [Xanthomonas massiliensis]|uniref:heme biosynthesis HemY N-terminal domain-containing protein n=1 Tax=Xanthomonas massiliensis TaxID=1720302 RepID=UPI0008260218|nr:heme biosynthesis HemY N-terminal domain-containing protein [Xanthomonas massiliensis]